jgi:hypothetical protein
MISKNLDPNTSQEGLHPIPEQRHTPQSLTTPEYELAAADLANFKMVLIENGPVFALAGNAHDPDLLGMIQTIKGENRGIQQPVGLVSPFDAPIGDGLDAIDAIDIDAIHETNLQRLAIDPELLTRRIGALAFLRGPADLRVKEAAILPNSIVPSQHGTSIQIFSPVGNPRGERFVSMTADKGVRLVMTSANISKDPEIVDVNAAWKFAAAQDSEMIVLHQYAPGEKPHRPRGSYPTFEIGRALTIVRAGFVELDLLKSLFSDFEVQVAVGDKFKATKYPDNVIRRQDLPAPYRKLEQDDLRSAILETFGFQD